MFTDLQDELVSYLQSQIAPGKHLESVDLVQFSDAPVPAQFHRAVTVDWDNKIDFAVTQSGVKATTRFAITTYVHSPQGEKVADRLLQDTLMRRQDGQWRGVLPALVSATGITTDNASYFLAVLPNVVRGITEKNRFSRAAAIVLIEASFIAYPQDFISP